MSESKNLLNVSIYCREFLLKTTAILRFCTITKENLKEYFEKPRIYVPIYKRPEKLYGVIDSNGDINLDEYRVKFYDEIIDLTKMVYLPLNLEKNWLIPFLSVRIT